VFSTDGGGPFPLDDELRPLVEAHATGVVALVGPPGSGKTTALEHLASVFPTDALTLFDGLPDRSAIVPGKLIVAALGMHNVVELLKFIRAATTFKRHRVIFRLAPWGDDDLIEYLLANHPARCGTVMKRLGPADRAVCGGVPELWRVVLDTLAGDDSLPSARAALRRHFDAHLPDTDARTRVRSACLNACVAQPPADVPDLNDVLHRVVRHPPVRLLLASDRMADDLRGDAACDWLALRLPRDLIATVATTVAGEGRCRDRLTALATGPTWSQAMAASLRHALGDGWAPDRPLVELTGAFLAGAPWPGAQLANANLYLADFSGADLSRADLRNATANLASFRRAKLCGAVMEPIRAIGADFTEADLTGVFAVTARLDCANLEGVDLTGARLSGANLVGANLNGARFIDMSLATALLSGTTKDGTHGPTGVASLEGATFHHVNLMGACMTGMRMRDARWSEVNFSRAEMSGCDLEDLEIAGAVFRSTMLRGALLTGTVMPQADFRAADLSNTGLADIAWEGANLRYANLSGASFHLGSTRSGLVGSPLACEGSRTGFYTDDFDEQSFKAPEEIRKANLCGADLRGAKVDGIDFYLVDLRGAKYDRAQAEHFRRCGAILESRVAE
jgi:uncharacterized protein YjbI with pentapeptide repeats/energy-coupling factor transporter ATP-binding protein EcfA2